MPSRRPRVWPASPGSRPSTLVMRPPQVIYCESGAAGVLGLRRLERQWGVGVRITLTWLRLEARRRWRSLIILALLVAVATATVLTAVAGARRGQSAYDRLWARTLPATATVLPNQPGFDWAKVHALPEVSALTRFPVTFGFALDCCPGASTGFPPADSELTRTIERPVMLAGRPFSPRRVDEVIVTPKFVASYGKGVGDTLTLHLATPQQINAGYDGSTGSPPRGPV